MLTARYPPPCSSRRLRHCELPPVSWSATRRPGRAVSARLAGEGKRPVKRGPRARRAAAAACGYRALYRRLDRRANRARVCFVTTDPARGRRTSQRRRSNEHRPRTRSATAWTPSRCSPRWTLIKAQPELARFQFRATNRWIDGAHNRSTIKGFYAAGGEDTTRARGVRDRRRRAGDPARHRHRRQPGRVPAARARRLPDDVDRLRGRGAQGRAHSVESTLTGDMDVRGALGVGRRAPQRVRAHRRVVPRDGQRAGGEAPRGRGARAEALGRLRHGHQRRARRRRRDDRQLARAVAGAAPATAATRRLAMPSNSAYRRRRPPRGDRRGSSPASSPPRAAEHDRDGSYPFEAIDALKAAGYFAAPVPVELGGLGVSSAHDLVVASSRLARGDASVAIGVNMHLVAVLNMERRRQVAVAAGATSAAPAASPRRSSRSPATASCWPPRSASAARTSRGRARRATRTASGWRIDGRKMFCTMSPAATDLYVGRHLRRRRGRRALRYAMVPTDAPGVVVHDDWDALGMRASGSNSVSLEGVELPESGVRGGFRAGDPVPYMERNLVAGLFHAAASLGIAESADAIARRGIAGRINGDARPRMQVADNAVDLAACARRPVARGRADRRAPRRQPGVRRQRRASSRRCSPRPRPPRRSSTRRPPASSTARSPSPAAPATSTAARSRAPTATSRPARFMHPLGANRAYDYLGQLEAGREPELH